MGAVITYHDMSIRHNRKPNRLKGYDYSQAGAYFITICTQNREYLFGEINNGLMSVNEYGGIVWECWYDLPHHYAHVQLDIFVVMPNHVHGIIFFLVITCCPNLERYQNGSLCQKLCGH